MKRTIQTVTAGVSGVVIGSIVALLFAPQSGKKSRDKIVKVAKALKEKQ